MSIRKKLNVCVLGSGSFGTALASVTARCGHNIKILTRSQATADEINKNNTNTKFFPAEIKLEPNIKATTDLEEAFHKVDFILHAIPVQQTYKFVQDNLQYFPEKVPVCVASKGILLEQKKFFSQAWNDMFKGKKVPHVVLSGPSFAIEMMKKYPTAITCASKYVEVSKFIQTNMNSTEFRVYTTSDVIGTEIGGALKNPLAIGAGIVEGQGLGYNSITALVTRGIFELSLFSKEFGGHEETLYGMSGIGDVMLTCLGNLSRNKSVGIRLGKGQTLEQIVQENKEVAEGVPTLKVLGEIIKEHNLNMPLMNTLHRCVFGQISLDEARMFIMGRDPEHERELRI